MSEDLDDFVPDAGLINQIDFWRAQQLVPLSRSQAIAELVRAGLREQTGQALTLGDKLILSLLCDVSGTLESDGVIDPEFLQAAIKGGHTWAIEWQHPSLAHGHTNSQNTADFVTLVLAMWRVIEESFARLPDDERNRVEQGAGLSAPPVFPGWDAEQEANFKSTARFMTDRMNLFPMFKGRSATDSGGPMLNRYKQMLIRFPTLRSQGPDQALDGSELIELLRMQ